MFPETILQNCVQNAVNSNYDNKLTYSQGYNEDGYVVLDSEISNDTQELYALQRLVLIGHTQYTLLATFINVNDLNNGAEVLYNNFINSFELKAQ